MCVSISWLHAYGQDLYASMLRYIWDPSTVRHVFIGVHTSFVSVVNREPIFRGLPLLISVRVKDLLESLYPSWFHCLAASTPSTRVYRIMLLSIGRSTPTTKEEMFDKCLKPSVPATKTRITEGPTKSPCISAIISWCKTQRSFGPKRWSECNLSIQSSRLASGSNYCILD